MSPEQVAIMFCPLAEPGESYPVGTIRGECFACAAAIRLSLEDTVVLGDETGPVLTACIPCGESLVQFVRSQRLASSELTEGG